MRGDAGFMAVKDTCCGGGEEVVLMEVPDAGREGERQGFSGQSQMLVGGGEWRDFSWQSQTLVVEC